MKLRNVLIGCGIVLIVVCIGGAAAVYFGGKAVVNTIGAPITASNDFMTALIAKDYAKAYGMVLPAQQANFGGSANGMKDKFSSAGIEPSSYTFLNFQLLGSQAIVNDTGSVGGATKYIYINLQQDSDTWKILGFDVNDNAPTATPAAK